MRFAARAVSSLVLTVFVVAACGEQRDPVGIPDAPQFSEHAGAPVGEDFTVQFPAFNPCTNQGTLVTNTGTIWFQPHPNNNVVRVKGTTTSSVFVDGEWVPDGYTGSYNETWTGSDNGPGDMSIRTINSQVTHPSGSRFMVHLVWVIDVTGAWEFQVDRFSATCVIP